jgi:riboflavin kinase/FMN adenylyltransferase
MERFSGLVEHGDGRGQGLGYPTANLRLDSLAKSTLSSGVYACRVLVGNESARFDAVANIGVRPTFQASGEIEPGGQQPRSVGMCIEVHILDFSGDLYGETMKVELVERLRDEQRFGEVGQLKEQIERDVEKARAILD